MANKLHTHQTFIPWLRRGLSRQISEMDQLGRTSSSEGTLQRPNLKVESVFDLMPVEEKKEEKVTRKESIKIDIVGPGDVEDVLPVTILQVVPAPGVKNFEKNYFPFISFFEEDLPWRYTPAAADQNKLRPWLHILVCKAKEFDFFTNKEGKSYVRLRVKNNEGYKQIFSSPRETYKNAHVQFPKKDLKKNNLNETINKLLENDGDLAFSRLLSTRILEKNTAYTAFLIPAFETGRLSGLDCPFDNIPAQASAWEEDYDRQKAEHQRPLDFPVYFHWEFETSTGDFITLARKLKPISTKNLPAALHVDVQKMGNGLAYRNLKKAPQRRRIDIPVATRPADFDSTAFPEKKDEQEIAKRMKMLLAKSPDLFLGSDYQPDLLDIRKVTGRTISSDEHKKEDQDVDDPWIVPPLYGAKPILATSLKEKDNQKHPWFPELNLDVRQRAAAGLGASVVQENQEKFIQRAWEQVARINELNQRLREHVMKLKVNTTLYEKRFKSTNLQELMLNYQTMKYYPVGKEQVSVNYLILKKGIPTAYASRAFQRLSVRKKIPREVTPHSLTEQIVEDMIFEWKDHQINDLLTPGQIKNVRDYLQHFSLFETLIKYM